MEQLYDILINGSQWSRLGVKILQDAVPVGASLTEVQSAMAGAVSHLSVRGVEYFGDGSLVATMNATAIFAWLARPLPAPHIFGIVFTVDGSVAQIQRYGVPFFWSNPDLYFVADMQITTVKLPETPIQ